MKKFLSLVLALVMAMSLVTVSAGAADFDDNGDIDYKEAVDVISALGIVDGYSDDTFRPDGSLTRGAAAKIICNLILGPTTASALSASSAPFKDVPTNNVFAGYITYCAQQGIISGYGDGTFRPSGSLSGNAFMKMLLGALGYDSSVEGYTGANWQVNVVKQAIGIGLDDGNDGFVGSNPVTRQEAALYAFNMINATMVEYDSRSTVVVGDVHVETVPSRNEVANSTKTDGNIDGERNGDGLMQFGERYFKDLEKQDATDLFGAPATKWVYDGDDVGTYANSADETYVVDDDKMSAQDVLTSPSYMNYKAAEIRGADYTLNGEEAKASDDVMKGDIVSAYENSDGDVETVVITRYRVALIDKVDDEVNTTESRNGASLALTLTDLDGDNGEEYYDAYDDAEKSLRGYDSSYDEGTVLAVAFRGDTFGDEVLASYVADTDSGNVTGYRANESVTVDGTKYFMARYDASTKNWDGADDNFDFDEDYTIYLTADGYAIGIAGADTVDLADVYYVAGVYGEESRYNNNKMTWYAQAVSLADGSVSDIEIKNDSAKENKNALNEAIKQSTTPTGKFVPVKALYTFDDDIATKWSGNSNDEYMVYGIGGLGTLSRKLTKDLAMDATRFSTNGTVGTFYVDGSTQYLGIDDQADDIDTVYAVGGMKADTTGNVIVIVDKEEERDAVYVILVDTGASIGSTDILYAAGDSTERVGKDEYVREFWFMDDNSSDELSIDEKLSKRGFYKVDSIDEDGIYSLDEYTKSEADDIIDEDSDGIAIVGLELDDTKQIYRSALTDTIDGTKFDDISIANAVIIDARSETNRDSSVYGREVDSVARLESALEAATDEGDTVTIDLYVTDGEITFICVQNVGEPIEDEDPLVETSVSGVDKTFNVSEENANDSALRATILAQDDGVYQVLGDIPDNCNQAVPSSHLVYFVTTNDVAGSAYTLTIFNEDEEVVYTETYAGDYGVGKVMAYVNIAAGTDSDVGSGSGEYVSKDFEPGTYNFVFTCGTTPTRGSFEID